MDISGPSEIPTKELAEEPSTKFHSIAVQACPFKRNVRTQVVPKMCCKG